MTKKIASYDMFDTALIRKCGNAKNIFFLLAQELYPNSETKKETFFSWRLHAEAFAERTKKYPNINDIYNSYPTEIFIEYSKEYVIGKEYGVERKNLIGVPVIRESIKEQRSQGWKVVFISDMYLDSSFLKSILIEQGLYEKNDEIFVSSEYSASKADGNLFDLVAQKLSPYEWKHTGDNIHSDVMIPSKKNINVSHFKADYTEVEKYILKKKQGSKYNLYYSIVMGLCRYARVVYNKNAYNPDFSADFVAPIYLSFLLDVLKISNKEGINRIYFLARDGWLLFLLAKILYKEKLEIRYFYASRKSLYLPSLQRINFKEIVSYFGLHDQNNVSLQKIIEYFDIKDILPNYTTGKIDLEEFKDILKRQEVQIKIKDTIQSKLSLISAYFQQEGLLEEKCNYAFVDIGWKGSGLYALNKLQKKMGVKVSSCFYWGTLERCRNDFPIAYYTHVFSKTLPNYFINLIEDYFSANPQLSTIGYRKNSEDKVEPVFDETSDLHNEGIAFLNQQIAATIAQSIVDFNLQDEVVNIFAEIEDILINIIKTKPYLFDVKAINETNCKKNEGKTAFIRKIDFLELLKYVFGMKLEVLWNEASVCYTYPHLSKCILKLHSQNSKRIHKLKNKVKKYSVG